MLSDWRQWLTWTFIGLAVMGVQFFFGSLFEVKFISGILIILTVAFVDVASYVLNLRRA